MGGGQARAQPTRDADATVEKGNPTAANAAATATQTLSTSQHGRGNPHARLGETGTRQRE
eukprot:5461088-Pyramimonas_sp.AAC.1